MATMARRDGNVRLAVLCVLALVLCGATGSLVAADQHVDLYAGDWFEIWWGDCTCDVSYGVYTDDYVISDFNVMLLTDANYDIFASGSGQYYYESAGSDFNLQSLEIEHLHIDIQDRFHVVVQANPDNSFPMHLDYWAEDNTTLAAGAVVGIIAGCLIGACLCTFWCRWIRRRRRRRAYAPVMVDHHHYQAAPATADDYSYAQYEPKSSAHVASV